MTESDVIIIIDKIADRLACRFKFGYHDLEDIKQEARLYALQGLKYYDNKRPLENFLWIHVKNRLCNFKRNKYERLNKPCLLCQSICYNIDTDICDKYEDLFLCNTYKHWFNRNTAKKNLMIPIDLDSVDDVDEDYMHHVDNIEDLVANQELKQLIDDNLPIEFRADYLCMLSGISIAKYKYDKIKNIIIDILERYGYKE